MTPREMRGMETSVAVVVAVLAGPWKQELGSLQPEPVKPDLRVTWLEYRISGSSVPERSWRLPTSRLGRYSKRTSKYHLSSILTLATQTVR